MIKVGIAGVPDQQILDAYIGDGAEVVDLDMPLDDVEYFDVIEDVSPKIYCPSCGSQMLLRAYNYYYVIPVDKCLSCHKVWFDSDEMEILQILIEHRSPQ